MITVGAALLGIGTVLGVLVARRCATRRERAALTDVTTALRALRADIAALPDHLATCGPPAATQRGICSAVPPRQHVRVNDTVPSKMLSHPDAMHPGPST